MHIPSYSIFLLCDIVWYCSFRGESDIHFRPQWVIMTLAVEVWNSEKIIEFQSSLIVMNCQWVVYLFNYGLKKIIWYLQNKQICCKINQLLKPWARIVRVLSSCPDTQPMYTGELSEKSSFCSLYLQKK